MRWPLELRGARVSEVESAEVRRGDDFAETVFDLSRLRSVAFEGQVAAVPIVIGHVAKQGLQQVPLTERDDVIRAFSADGTEHAFGVWILPWRFPGTDHFFDEFLDFNTETSRKSAMKRDSTCYDGTV